MDFDEFKAEQKSDESQTLSDIVGHLPLSPLTLSSHSHLPLSPLTLSSHSHLSLLLEVGVAIEAGAVVADELVSFLGGDFLRTD